MAKITVLPPDPPMSAPPRKLTDEEYLAKLRADPRFKKVISLAQIVGRGNKPRSMKAARSITANLREEKDRLARESRSKADTGDGREA